MKGYEVQFFSKETNSWLHYNLHEYPSDAAETVEYLNSVGRAARVITYRMVKEVTNYYPNISRP